jgi:hypothetical protein
MNHGKARTEGKTRYCFTCSTFKLTDGFRSLPGMKRREICADCYAAAIPSVSVDAPENAPAKFTKTSSHPDIENTVKTKRLM